MEEQYNKTSTQIRETMRENVREGLMVQEMQKKICRRHQADSFRSAQLLQQSVTRQYSFIPTQVEVQIITREPKVKEEEIERVKKELRDFTERINKGETTFSTLARLYSEDPEFCPYGR